MKLVRDVFLEDVEVIDASDLGGAFAEPAVLLIYARIYLDEVDTREVDLTALLVYGPVDVDGGVLAVVQFVVGIAVAELIQHIVRADAALVLGVLWEARTAEGELVALDPLREVGLCVPLGS